MKRLSLVYCEHTLGYEIAELSNQDRIALGVLHTSIIKGSTLSHLCGFIYVDAWECRNATREDFDDYRVMYNNSYIVH